MISTGLRYIIAGEVWDLSSPWLDSLVLCKEIKSLVSLVASVVPDGFIFTMASAITTQQVDGYREWELVPCYLASRGCCLTPWASAFIYGEKDNCGWLDVVPLTIRVSLMDGSV
uniref:Uncharacterized protein n=1 Tax=Coccidioides posadasii RMSCC 3488 TaxID=454284 RepID=A0A0J6F5T9_COCPO|nr:hypothetical protein CPAG_00671 [Coccidioides posadasii RMSCC 3488]